MRLPFRDAPNTTVSRDTTMSADTSDVRLVWAPASAGRPLDGAWWPRTREASAELVDLVPAVSEHLGGPVLRVSINIDAWNSEQPRRLRVADELVRVGWFHTLGPETVTLGRRNDDRVTLVVIPPSLDAPSALALLQRLSTTANWPQSARSALSGTWGSGADGPEEEDLTTSGT
jgi:hypothetical protein